MELAIRRPLLNVPDHGFCDRLNRKMTSPLLLAKAREYATVGRLTQFATADGKEIRGALGGFADLILIWGNPVTRWLGDHGAPVRIAKPSERLLAALDWMRLLDLVATRIPLRICVDQECHRFFIAPKRRPKTACSAACGNRLRARARLEQIKATPRKYKAYLKKQRELMRARRAAGLA